MAAAVRAQARDLGFDLVGFGAAEPFNRERELILEDLAQGRLDGMNWITPERVRLSCEPQLLLPGARAIIGLGTSYAPAEHPTSAAVGSEATPATRKLTGRVARYAWGRDYHQVIPPKLRELAERVRQLAGPETRCRTFVDTGPLVDRAAAVRAGLGFVGKNTCLLSGPHGSYIFLSAILTTAEIAPDPRVARDCGSCTACLDACPTGALLAPQQIDATRCISYLTIEHRGSIPTPLRPLMGDWVFGCDLCQEVCPWNRARPTGLHSEFGPNAGPGPELDLVEVLALDEAAFRARFTGTALTRTKRRGLLRNAAVALGNRRDPAAVPALLRALGDPEPLVREHAAWALGRLGPLPEEARQAAQAALETESDEGVRRELRGLLRARGIERAG